MVAPFALARVVVSRLWFLRMQGTVRVRMGAGRLQLSALMVPRMVLERLRLEKVMVALLLGPASRATQGAFTPGSAFTSWKGRVYGRRFIDG